RLLVLDEPTSALDVSVQATILHLLSELRDRLGMSYLFVSHDLNLVRLLTDRVPVMDLGKIVERGRSEEVSDRPAHPYTRALMSAVPAPDPAARRARIALVGEPRSPIDPPPTVCRFHGRCPDGVERCTREMPVLRPGPAAAPPAPCHFGFAAGARVAAARRAARPLHRQGPPRGWRRDARRPRRADPVRGAARDHEVRRLARLRRRAQDDVSEPVRVTDADVERLAAQVGLTI